MSRRKRSPLITSRTLTESDPPLWATSPSECGLSDEEWEYYIDNPDEMDERAREYWDDIRRDK